MPQLDLDGANSKISADTIRGQSGTTVTVQSGHNLVGSGSGLTALPAGNLTGTVADARISALTASKLTGALPAISGASLTGITGNTYMWDTTKNLADSSATTITLSGAGFTPKLVIGWANIGNTDVTAFGMQASTPVAKRSFSNVVTGSYTNHYGEFLRLIPVAANDADFNVTTWGADGITITYDKHNSPTGTARLVIAAFG